MKHEIQLLTLDEQLMALNPKPNTPREGEINNLRTIVMGLLGFVDELDDHELDVEIAGIRSRLKELTENPESEGQQGLALKTMKG